jgi:hypothetical protein
MTTGPKDKRVNAGAWVVSILCMASYCVFCAYIIVASQATFRWNVSPVKGGLPPLWCGTDISSGLMLIFNVIVPIHCAAAVVLAVQCFRRTTSGTMCLFATVLFLVWLVNMLALGSWLYSAYLGTRSLGEQIWWM